MPDRDLKPTGGCPGVRPHRMRRTAAPACERRPVPMLPAGPGRGVGPRPGRHRRGPGRRVAQEVCVPPDEPRTGPEALMDVEAGPSGGENVVRRIIATSEDGDAVVEVISESGRKHVYQYRHRGQVRAEAYSL